MTLAFDPSDDLARVADGLQSVTLTRPGSSATTAISDALCGRVTTDEAKASQGAYTASDAVWHLPDSALGSPPRLGDVIVDGIVDGNDQRWTVLAVTHTTLEGRWRCVCRNLAIAHGLDEYVDIEKVAYTKGADGAEQPTWRTWKTGLAAKIQPVEADVDDLHQRQVTTARFKVFLAEPLPLDHTHRIKGPDGTLYRVTGYQKADRIDALVEIHVTRVS
jgi:hypothetical protein